MAHTPAFSSLRRILAIAGYARLHGIPAHEAEEAWEAARVSRRSVLQGASAAAGVGLTGLPGCGRDKDPAKVRVAVVGGGVAGLHAAWRLVEAGFDARLYEASDRVGGRMYTAKGELPNGRDVELGGELVDTNHATMWALAEEFGIDLDDRWAEEPPGMEREVWWFDGRAVPVDTLLDQALTVMDTMAEQTNGADSDDAIYEELDQISLKEWLNTYVPADVLPELHAAFEVSYVGEYGLEADEQGCLNLLYLFGWDNEEEFLIFGVSDERYHIHGGNSVLTDALADAIGSDRIETGRELVAASGKEDGPYTLTFAKGDDVECDHIVFALPFTCLRKTNLRDLELKAIKREIIGELAYGTNAKIMMGTTRRPWWEDHANSGLLTTDLPAQQGWDSTLGQSSGTGGVWTNFTGGDQGLACGEGTAEAWIDARIDDTLEVVWPGMRDAWDGSAVRMHWPTFKWALGSYTCYTVGQWAYWSLEGRRNGNVHFCGEHCSLDFQGWMEGAAETGGLVAAEIMDDYGVARTAAHTAALLGKLDLPQASYHGDLVGRIPAGTRSARRLYLAEQAAARWPQRDNLLGRRG